MMLFLHIHYPHLKPEGMNDNSLLKSESKYNCSKYNFCANESIIDYLMYDLYE